MENTTLQKHILVLDDELKICEMIAEVLNEEGYEVTCFTNGGAALQFLEKQTVDLILLDLCMPGINGIQVIEQLHKADRKEKIIVLSALDGQALIKQSLKSRIMSFLEKPVDLKDLVYSIEKVIATGSQIPSQLIIRS